MRLELGYVALRLGCAEFMGGSCRPPNSFSRNESGDCWAYDAVTRPSLSTLSYRNDRPGLMEAETVTRTVKEVEARDDLCEGGASLPTCDSAIAGMIG